MEVARTSMCHASAPQFLWPQAVRYTAHQLNLWPSDARPRMTPVSLRTGSWGVAADYRVYGSLAHVRAPGANKLSPRTRACIFLGFPLDTSGWQFYDQVTCQFFSSQDVTFDKSPHPLRVLPRQCVARHSAVVPPPQCPVPVVSGGAGGAVAESEGTQAIGARGADFGGAGGVREEATPEEDTAVSTQRPHPASPPGFPSVPQFPPRSPPRLVAAEPWGILAGGTGVPGGVVGGGSGSGGAGAGDTSTATPTLRTVRFLTCVQRLDRLEREERERFERARLQQQQQQQQHQQQQSQSERHERVEEETLPHQERVEEELEQESHPQQQVKLRPKQERVEQESRPPQQQQVQLRPQQERVEQESEPPQQVLLQPQRERAEEEPKEQQRGQVLQQKLPEEAEQQRLRDLPVSPPVPFVRGPLPSPPVPPVESLSSSQWTRRSPLSRALSTEPRRSRYRADGLFHLVLRSRVPPPPIFPQPPESSLTVFHDPLSDYLRASRSVVSHVLSAMVTHPTAPPLSVLALVTTVSAFASSYHLDCAAHLVSGTARSPSSGGALVFPLETTAEEAKMASYRSTGTYIDAVPPPGTNVVSGMWLYKVKRPPGAPPVFKVRYLARGFTQCDYELHSLDFFTAFIQGSLHEQICLRRPPSFIGTFSPGTQWQLRRPVYGLRQAPREWHDKLRTTLAALDFFSSSADPSLFVRRGSTPFFVLVYVDDLVFATPDRRALAFMKEELKRRHTCTDLGELQRYLGLQITRDRAARTITLTQSHMVKQILTRYRFPFSKVQPTPLAMDHGLTAPPSNEPFESSGPYPELVGCLIYKAEVYAAAMAAQELRWLSFLLTDLGERPHSPPVLFVDNKSAILLCKAIMRHVVSEANTADIFTKALPPCDHKRFCTQLGLVSTGPHFLA
ncbi:unnamed protein product [Closterium sp. NIES-54]